MGTHVSYFLIVCISYFIYNVLNSSPDDDQQYSVQILTTNIKNIKINNNKEMDCYKTKSVLSIYLSYVILVRKILKYVL